jgi:hypothetical protein
VRKFHCDDATYQQCRRLILWFMWHRRFRRNGRSIAVRRAAKLIGTEDLIHEVLCTFVRKPPPTKWRLATTVLNQVYWTAYRILQSQRDDKRRLNPYRLPSAGLEKAIDPRPQPHEAAHELDRQAQLREFLEKAMCYTLHGRDRLVMKLRWGLNPSARYYSYAECCPRLALKSVQFVITIEARALRRLRYHDRNPHIPKLLGLYDCAPPDPDKPPGHSEGLAGFEVAAHAWVKYMRRDTLNRFSDRNWARYRYA